MAGNGSSEGRGVVLSSISELFFSGMFVWRTSYGARCCGALFDVFDQPGVAANDDGLL